MCAQDNESVNHLLIHSDVTSKFCVTIINLFGMGCVSDKVMDLLDHWRIEGAGKRGNKGWALASVFVMWLIGVGENVDLLKEL